MATEESHDYIVVGAGAAGCVIAARLAEAGKRVLVLDAGDDPLRQADRELSDRPVAADYRVPAFHAYASENPELRWNFWVRHYTSSAQQQKDWNYRQEWEGEKADGVLYPRASGLGGCAGHNAMITVRPNGADWNHIWQLTSDDSWRASNMQKYFRRLERCRYRLFLFRWLDWLFGWNPTGHGWNGWLTTERAFPLRALFDWPLRRTFKRALLAASSQLPDAVDGWGWFSSNAADPNDERRVAAQASMVCVTPIASARHARCSPREFLLDMQRKFPDRLTIRLNTLITRIDIDRSTRTASGVFYCEGRRLYRASARPHGVPGEEKYVRAGREVILAAGVFNTPQLLMLSGIGDAGHLADHGIAAIKDLPGVGRNLQDRYEIGVVNRMKRPWKALKGSAYRVGDWQHWKWRLLRTGPYTSNGLMFAVLFPSRTNREQPDLCCFLLLADFRGYHPGYSDRIRKLNYLTWTVLKAYTTNTAGTVRLRSGKAVDPPAIDFKYFHEGNGAPDDDLDAVVTGIKFGRNLADSIGDLIAEEESPGRHLNTEAQLRDHVTDNAWGHHACGTCAMKPEEQGGVVDSKFRVHGVNNLRVVDASIFPRIPGYFIVASVYMVAEKAADVIVDGR